MKKLITLLIPCLYPFLSIGQDQIQHLTVKQYLSDPNEAIDAGKAITQNKTHLFTLTEIPLLPINNFEIQAEADLPSKEHLTITLKCALLDSIKQNIDTIKSLVSAQKIYGIDAVPSDPDFYSYLYNNINILMDLDISINNKILSVPKPLLLNVWIRSFKCFISYDDRLVIMMFQGGDGAGWYNCFNFYHIDQKTSGGWYFNWCDHPETYCSDGFDYFSNSSKRRYYTFNLGLN